MPAVEAFGGRFLTRSAGQIQANEAGLQQRTILVEIDSYDIALATQKREAYQQAPQELGSGAERDFRIVEGAQGLAVSAHFSSTDGKPRPQSFADRITTAAKDLPMGTSMSAAATLHNAGVSNEHPRST